MHFYFPGAIVGVIILQVSIVAPTMFRTLEMEEFGLAIRKIWPKFFMLLTAVAVLGLVSMVITGDGNNIHLGIAGFTALSAGFCYAIIPATNRATDEGDKKKFDILHKLSVWLTVAMLLTNIASIRLRCENEYQNPSIGFSSCTDDH